MLTRQDNESLTRVGPDTPMGRLMREYWLPLMLDNELPGPDGKPMRMRLLGEELVAIRDTSGRIGLFGKHCAHRGAPLIYARNEQDGLRCVYHGWKYDVTGRCVDMPNEPAETNFSHKVRQKTYPCVSRGGLIWTYMGPKETPPPLPDLEWNMTPDNLPTMWQYHRACNWMQALEGAIDSSHAGFLHAHVDLRESMSGAGTVTGIKSPGQVNDISLAVRDRTPRMEVVDTEYGSIYTAKRVHDPAHTYHRIHPFLFPFHTMVCGGTDELSAYTNLIWVPMDDVNTMVFEVQYRPENPWTAEEREAMRQSRNPHGFLAPSVDVGSPWRLAANGSNDYFHDYELQRNRLFVGIVSNCAQDAAMQEGMGPIYERWNEHLGASDAMVIHVRKRLLQASRALAETGARPPGADHPELYRVRPTAVILPKESDWIEATKQRRQAFFNGSATSAASKNSETR
ncbi:MAG: Rieske 2Fe-2S domain-containing protein [Burkholderiales bacterium]